MKIKQSLILILALSFTFNYAQNRTKDTIDSQTVNVIKPYTPTISDAFKIKDIPSLDDANTIKKKEVKYNIFSIPVASTFTPAKGKAAKVDKAAPVKLYDNYASLGVGTYTTILGEVYLNHELSNGENVGGYFSHHSSDGGVDDVLLDNDFSKTNFNANYSKKLSDFSWKIDLGAELQNYNWYGLPQQFFGQAEANTIDPEIKYNSFYIGGKLKFDDAIIKDGSVRFRRFGDDRDSGENRFVAKVGFGIPVQGEEIDTEIKVDYISGEFDRNFVSTESINYGNVSVGLSPSYQIKQDDLTIDLGAKFVYLNDTELNDNRFFIYPNIEASYRLVDDILISYAGVKGDLIQNSYFDFASSNPFVSPTLLITPTDQRYKAFIGLKGKLSNSVSYNIKGNYYAEDTKALFRTNEAQTFASEAYQFGNSFNVVYDDVDTFSVAGELNIDVNRNFKLAIKGEYFNYSTDNEAEAWNLPDVTGSIFLDYQISEKWFMGGSVFFVGERKDQLSLVGTLIDTTPITVTLDSYFDANAHVGYKVTDQLSAFVKANNIANQDYDRWLNFPVQGIQFLAGATYQFDF
ncbi:TonB-dependent receptor [Winogradskyella immobilis]|uniref:TonB-dependent receptor n=1 Tax=Winogradskyella immobilis TaxID=2816852 RepID=A0ABS8ELK9_9FLAO|nr:TonB-dependent receptor [Winogradskyella immobilis]MCC1484103.1 TonB-dependent receptor [Winogradskyella immobilis]MCG0016195.1 TonB-dependent receptor [Winogradskyella immobilis]